MGQQTLRKDIEYQYQLVYVGLWGEKNKSKFHWLLTCQNCGESASALSSRSKLKHIFKAIKQIYVLFVIHSPSTCICLLLCTDKLVLLLVLTFCYMVQTRQLLCSTAVHSFIQSTSKT